VKRMTKVVHHDWKHSHPLDLTDAGLEAELEQHHIDIKDRLALE
jgi:cardiolipin synthase